MAARHLVQRGQVHETRRADLQAIRLVGAIGDHIDTELALRRLDRGIHLTGRHAIAFGEQLEVVDERFHVILHRHAVGRRDLVVADHHRPRIPAQPVDALADETIRLTHLLDANQVAIVAIAVDPDRDVEIETVIHFIGLFFAQVPFDARSAQHGPGKTEIERALGADRANADRALFPDAIVGQQGFVFVDVTRKPVGKILDEIEQRAAAVGVEPRRILRVSPATDGVLRHAVRQVAVQAAGTIVGGVHARARDRLVHVEHVLALAEGVQEYRHGADVERVRAQPHQVVQDARDLVEHRADVLGADGWLDAEQLLDRHHVGVLVAHHRHVIEPVHVTDRLVVWFGLGQLFGGAVQQADVRIGAFDHLAVHLQHQAQHAVRRRVLRAEVHGVISDLSHGLSEIPPLTWHLI